jgi:hypothetical protein
MTVEEIVQLTLEYVPVVENDSENGGPEVCEKITAKEAQICLKNC